MIKKELKFKIKEIKEFLKERYSAKVIILVGSRAIGDYKKNSDWDVYMFSNKIVKETPNEFFNALPETLKDEDIDLYKYDFKKDYPDKLLRDLRCSEVILDSKNFGKKLRKKALGIKAKKWTKEYAQGRIYKAERYMKKFEDNLKDKKYGELFLRISWHYSENVIDWWFEIRQEYALRPQEAFPYIKKKDPKFYRELKKVFSETDYRSKINAFKRIHKLLFESSKFRKLV